MYINWSNPRRLEPLNELGELSSICTIHLMFMLDI